MDRTLPAQRRPWLGGTLALALFVAGACAACSPSGGTGVATPTAFSLDDHVKTFPALKPGLLLRYRDTVFPRGGTPVETEQTVEILEVDDANVTFLLKSVAADGKVAFTGPKVARRATFPSEPGTAVGALQAPLGVGQAQGEEAITVAGVSQQARKVQSGRGTAVDARGTDLTAQDIRSWYVAGMGLVKRELYTPNTTFAKESSLYQSSELLGIDQRKSPTEPPLNASDAPARITLTLDGKPVEVVRASNRVSKRQGLTLGSEQAASEALLKGEYIALVRFTSPKAFTGVPRLEDVAGIWVEIARRNNYGSSLDPRSQAVDSYKKGLPQGPDGKFPGVTFDADPERLAGSLTIDLDPNTFGANATRQTLVVRFDYPRADVEAAK